MSQTRRPVPWVRTPTGPLPGPDPTRLAGLLVRAWLEVRSRRRPLAQIAPLLAPTVRRRLAAQIAPRTATPRTQPVRVRRICADAPSPTACEAAVVVEQGARTSAIAVRLERHRGAWRVVELAAPEAGLPPLPTASLPAGHRHADAFDEVLAEAGEEGTRAGS